MTVKTSAGAPARRRLAPEDRKRALIEAALDLFNRFPYDDVSVDDIAAAAQMSRPLVYHYYGGKAGVYLGAAQYSADQLVEVMESAGWADRPSWFTAGMTAYLDFVEANPIGFTSLVRSGSGPGGELEAILHNVRGRILDLILLGLSPRAKTPLLRAVLHGWLGMIEVMCRDWLRVGRPARDELEQLIPELLRAVLAGSAHHDPAIAEVVPRLPRPRNPSPA